MATMAQVRTTTRPLQVVLAFWLNVALTAANVAVALAWPDLEDRASIIVVSTVFGALVIAAGVSMYTGSRKGAIATLVLAGISILMSVPVFIQSDVDPEVIVFNVIGIAIGVITIVALLQPAAKAYWNRKS
ncbi:hypothetical protein AYO38_11120 [bacterium SCGC AG-212-C10]|nr:hypothetical protein AYO38_11120 [bacterium SCGC AG-212-C10]